MKHLHLKETSSTQDYLINLSPKFSEEILISTSNQTKGHGRGEKAWISTSDSLTMSFTLSPNEITTLTSLEVGVLIKLFFLKNFKINLFLKWPNDLLDLDKNKVGGILINRAGDGPCIVGVGLNLFKAKLHKINSEYGVSSIFKEEIKRTNLEEEIYRFILSNRLQKNELKTKWQESCIHLDKEISFIEHDKKDSFIFRGLGELGEALLENKEGEILKKYTGSIRI